MAWWRYGVSVCSWLMGETGHLTLLLAFIVGPFLEVVPEDSDKAEQPLSAHTAASWAVAPASYIAVK